MDEKTTYWASIVLSALALVLLVINISVIDGNRRMQTEISQRQTAINSSMAYGKLDQGLVQALADISIKNSDTDARELLAAQGITLKPKADEAKEAKDSAKESKKKPENKEEE